MSKYGAGPVAVCPEGVCGQSPRCGWREGMTGIVTPSVGTGDAATCKATALSVCGTACVLVVPVAGRWGGDSLESALKPGAWWAGEALSKVRPVLMFLLEVWRSRQMDRVLAVTQEPLQRHGRTCTLPSLKTVGDLQCMAVGAIDGILLHFWYLLFASVKPFSWVFVSQTLETEKISLQR